MHLLSLMLMMSWPSDPLALEGVWSVTGARMPDQDVRNEKSVYELGLFGSVWQLKKGDLRVSIRGREFQMRYKVKDAGDALAVDLDGELFPKDGSRRTVHAIAVVNGDHIWLAFNEPGSARPASRGERTSYSLDFHRVRVQGVNPVVAGVSGIDSRLHERQLERVWNADTWAKRSKQILGKPAGPPLPVVDFSRDEGIVISYGAVVNCRGLYLREVEETREHVRLRYDRVSYQTLQRPGQKPVPVYPYLFLVLKRSNREVILEENVQNLIGGVPVWKERARLAPGK